MSQSGPAYLAGLKLLARRELSEAQLRARLLRGHFDAAGIDDAVDRLRRERALDDRRTALACARTEVRLHRHGRAHVLRRVAALGIATDIAAAAVAEVFAEVDEHALLEQALDRRLRGGASLADEATARRVYRYLVTHGFDPAQVASVIAARGRRSSLVSGL